jgi:hypothetical protein
MSGQGYEELKLLNRRIDELIIFPRNSSFHLIGFQMSKASSMFYSCKLFMVNF